MVLPTRTIDSYEEASWAAFQSFVHGQAIRLNIEGSVPRPIRCG